LDDVLLLVDESEVLSNRHWIASLYRFFDGLGFDTSSTEQVMKIYAFMNWLEKNEASNDFQRKLVNTLREKARFLKKTPD
jgi:hypothetical protein